MNPRPIAAFLHLSDLHLGASFDDVGDRRRESMVRRFRDGAFVMQSHDPRILLTLPLEIGRLASLTRARFAAASMWGSGRTVAFDKVIVSGDISTDANDAARFLFAFEYLTSKVPTSTGRVYSHQGLVGLGIDRDRILCVPGNHDKLMERTLERYASAFSQAPAPTNYVTFIRCAGQPVLFIGMDSNGYTEGNIARGEIDADRLAWLSTTLAHLQSEGLRAGGEMLRPEEFETAVRVLVLHHHVVSLDRGRSIGGSIKQWFVGHTTVLDGAADLMALIAGRIDVVFHGHEHLPLCFVDESSNVLIISAGSTSQWHEKPRSNSFYVVTLMSDRSIEVQRHDWDGRSFTDRARDGTRLLASFPLYRLKRAA